MRFTFTGLSRAAFFDDGGQISGQVAALLGSKGAFNSDMEHLGDCKG